MIYANNINGEIKEFYRIPNSWIDEKGENKEGFRYSSKEVLEKYGFLEYRKPEIDPGKEYLSEIYLSEDKKHYKSDVLYFDVEIETLYQDLINEGEKVFEDFRLELSKAGMSHVLIGTIPEALKQLTQMMLGAKDRIKADLDKYLEDGNIEEMKKFRYDTPEAEQLKQAIQNFK